MAIILTSDVLIDNPDAPFITLYDPIESRTGSVYLWDAGRAPIANFNAGAVLPNVLATYAQTVVGAATTMSRDSVGGVTSIATEITQKGGLHLMASQVNQSTSTREYIQAQSDNTLTQYMIDNAANLYVSVWRKTTRKAISGGASSVNFVRDASNGAFQNPVSWATFENLNGAGLVYSYLSSNQTQDVNVNVANLLATSPTSGFKGTPVSTSATKMRIGAGALTPSTTATSANKSASQIVYRVYVEDLSKSGRTFSQVQAIDLAEFNKAFTEGGRFYGDTWSNPATVLP